MQERTAREQQKNTEDIWEESRKTPYVNIDLKKIVASSKPKLAGLIPGFVYRHLEKVLHLDDLDPFFERTHSWSAPDFLDACVEHLNLISSLEGPGAESLLNTERPVMVASNHPYGGPESLALMQKLIRRIPDIKLVAQAFLSFIRPMQECSVYNKRKVSTMLDAEKNGNSILIYPAGYCSRYLSFGEVFDYEWKPSFIKIAKRNNMPIYIIYTTGSVSKRTLNWTRFRNFFHIKASIESLYLPDEMYRMGGKPFTMTVAPPIDPHILTEDVSNIEWAARLRQYCHDLKDNARAVFDPLKPATLPLK